jgi:hypothetical protein
VRLPGFVRSPTRDNLLQGRYITLTGEPASGQPVHSLSLLNLIRAGPVRVSTHRPDLCNLRGPGRRNLQADTISKKCALTSPASGAGLDGGAPPVLFIQRSRLIGRRRADVRSLVVCAFLNLLYAYDPQDGANLEPDRPCRITEFGFKGRPRPCKARAPSDLRLSNLSPPSPESRRMWRLPSVWKNPSEIESRHINKIGYF